MYLIGFVTFIGFNDTLPAWRIALKFSNMIHVSIHYIIIQTLLISVKMFDTNFILDQDLI